MNGLSVVNEIVRVHGETLKPGQGFINIDLGVYCPYLDQDNASAEIRLYEDVPENLLTDYIMPKAKGIKNHVINHRYPNAGYVTLSKKVANKVCKTGTFVIDTIENLNKYKYLFVAISLCNKEFLYVIPVSINLTTEEPCANICLHELWILDEGLIIRTEGYHRNYWIGAIYCTDRTGFVSYKKRDFQNVNLFESETSISKNNRTMRVFKGDVPLPATAFKNILCL